MLARVANLSPASFGMVMATGIISLAANMLGLHVIAQILFVLNIVFYVVLCLLSLLRAVRYPARFFGDMIDHRQAPGFLTSVAATAILGSQFMILAGYDRVGMAMWFVTIAVSYTHLTLPTSDLV